MAKPIISVTPTSYQGFGELWRLPICETTLELILDYYKDLFIIEDSKIYANGTLGKCLIGPVMFYKSTNPMVIFATDENCGELKLHMRLDIIKGELFVTSKFWTNAFFSIRYKSKIVKQLEVYNIIIKEGYAMTQTYTNKNEDNLESILRNYTIKKILNDK